MSYLEQLRARLAEKIAEQRSHLDARQAILARYAALEGEARDRITDEDQAVLDAARAAIDAALAVERLGTSSVIYRIALFRAGDDEPCAVGQFVHVYVDRETRRPVPLPTPLKQFLETLT